MPSGLSDVLPIVLAIAGGVLPIVAILGILARRRNERIPYWTQFRRNNPPPQGNGKDDA